MNKFTSLSRIDTRKNSNIKLIRNKDLIAIVSNAFPNQSIKKVSEIKSGNFNTTYKIALESLDPIILRIAPNDALKIYLHETRLIKREYSVNQMLTSADKLVSKIIFADFTRKIINRDYTLQQFINGDIWDSQIINLSQQQNIDLWKQLIKISENISKVGDINFGFPDPKLQFTSWKLALISILKNMIQDLDKYSMNIYGPKELLELIFKDKKYINEISKAKLVHGDLWPKNVLMKVKRNKEVSIVGLIDSERAFWGDPRAEWIFPNSQFAGQKAKFNKMFRCALFSADYSEIPTEIGKIFNNQNIGEFFRDQVYLGIYLTQRKLESQRYPRSEYWIEDEFKAIIANLTKLF